MAYDKKTFLNNVNVLCDSGEQKNDHILEVFNTLGVKYRIVNLDYGDYSFTAQGRDFSLSCIIERKANINELYGNLTQDRERIEREFALANAVANDFTLLIENCADMEELKAYEVADWEMEKFKRKRKEIGLDCYAAIHSWQCGNRYKFNTTFVKENTDTASKILEHFYYYWRNYKILTANRRGIRKNAST